MKFQNLLKLFSRVSPVQASAEFSVTPGLPYRYSPSPLLLNSFMQTLYDSLTPITKINFKREKVFFDDGGHICLDWA